MSKRNSCVGSSNTLFNYFLKSPSANKSPKPGAETKINDTVTPLKPVSNGNVKRKNEEKLHKQNSKESDSEAEAELKPKKLKLDEPESSNDDDEDIPVVPKRKRIRLVSENSDDSDVENNQQASDNSSMQSKLENSFKFEPKISSPSSSLASKAKKQPKLDESKEVNTSFSEPRLPDSSEENNNWIHCRLDWLRPENIRDASKRKPDHPEYNPKTLFVPEDFKKKQTPGHRQWWDIKAAHYDCVLFFKVGKFYELYHMDAAIGVNELGFSYMKGDFAHSGFPETAYARMSSSLVQKGYKVARVEQTETPDMLAERTKSSASKEKVVRREVCQITCKGIEVFGLQDSGPTDSAASYMIAIAENDLGIGRSQYGVCFIDTSIGLFHFGQFEDDKYSSRLLTTLAHHPPALVLHERSHISERTAKILRLTCQAARKEALAPQKEFWSAEKALKTMAETYYKDTSGVKWPEGLEPMLSDSDMLGLTPAENYTLAVRALGACIFYLTDTLLDIQIMGMARYQAYHPPDIVGGETNSFKSKQASDMPSNMVLDACTLANLHIVGDETSLVAKLNHSATPMGKRLLQQWVCSPTCNIEVIKERQKAISFLLEHQSTVQDVRAVLSGLPDMERLLTKIHTLGNLNRSKNHPDSKAILYEMKAYSKRKVIDFISILNGFLSAVNVMSRFKDTESALLKRITQFAPEGQFPEYSEVLQFFKGAFDHNLAEKEGTILPEKGVDVEYDTAIETIEEIKSDLQDYLKLQGKHFNCVVNYFGSDKKRFQLEVPESKCGKANHGYNFEGTRKGYKRYSTVESKELLARMLAAEDHKTAVLKDLSRRIFEKFSQSHALWQKAIFCLSSLDVIIALAEYTRLQSCDMCIPELLLATDDIKPFISISEGRHPCMACKESSSLDDYIPNDTLLGTGREASLILLTGPNMGGKSTLMRQLGLLTIMAQIGCHIPAAECSLTLVDRIFTRLGAHDDIMTGQSTFFVELSETGAILKHATPHSLVLLDELDLQISSEKSYINVTSLSHQPVFAVNSEPCTSQQAIEISRGTSTYDGTAIAAAVLDELCLRRCRTIFSTHYHTLVEDVKNNPAVSLAHMSCMVETEENQSEDAENIAQETVTFMYKLSSGACPKSYGFNAARLAGISKVITRRAHQVSLELERETNLVAMFKKLFHHRATDGLKDLLISARKFEVTSAY